MNTHGRSKAPRGLVIAAFVAIYLIWGSTYLGIRFAVETLPPFLMGGARFLAAGLMLYVWLRATGTPAPSPVNWRHAVLASAIPAHEPDDDERAAVTGSSVAYLFENLADFNLTIPRRVWHL